VANSAPRASAVRARVPFPRKREDERPRLQGEASIVGLDDPDLARVETGTLRYTRTRVTYLSHRRDRAMPTRQDGGRADTKLDMEAGASS
jgi:hypothetical protein